jgi:mono/diheme cytochrome c family protein
MARRHIAVAEPAAGRRWLRRAAAAAGGMIAVVIAAAQAGPAPAAAAPSAVAGPLRESCGGCHTDGGREGGLDLDALLGGLEQGRPERGSAAHRDWVAVWHNLRAGTMPPPDEPQPDPDVRAAVLEGVIAEVLGVDAARPDPGHVVLRRLNRGEYGRTVRDLLGVSIDVAEIFPADDTGYGFDTIGSALGVSPLLMEKYLEAARSVAATAVAQGQVVATLPPDAPAADTAGFATVVADLATRAFRRPLDDDSLGRLVGLAAAGGRTNREAIETAVVALLGSPRFVFRVEAPDPGATAAPPGAGLPIDEHALASRLSYFLWGTMPDERLFAVARAGRLRADLAAEVDRLIDDDRADTFVAEFVGQWLQTRDVETMAFDLRRILGIKDRPEAEKVFNGAVRLALRREPELLFAHVLRQGLPATDLLVGGDTFMNGPLAAFYGLEFEGLDPADAAMRLVTLGPGSHRGGLLTTGAVLAVTSNPTRTSPVKRGLFVLDNLLGTPAPPAPPDVPPLEEAAATAGAGGTLTMRELMERHRREPLCASCHARMDPLGLALERYDAVGRYREDDGGEPIDTAGRLGTGETFADVHELSARIAGDRRRDFHRCLTEKMLTFALGRGLEYSDGPAVDRIVEVLEQGGGLRGLVHAIVQSVPFQRMHVPGEDSEP